MLPTQVVRLEAERVEQFHSELGSVDCPQAAPWSAELGADGASRGHAGFVLWVPRPGQPGDGGQCGKYLEPFTLKQISSPRKSNQSVPKGQY